VSRPTSGALLSHEAVLAAYRRYAPGYDTLFGPVLEPGRRRTVAQMAPRAGEAVLEIGVGTGLSLRHYPRHTAVTGIDLSPHMLARAARKVQRHGLSHVALHRMDAQRLGFADGSFDKVAAMYVASVVPDPAAMMAEAVRVCRSGGEIYVLNHFSTPVGLARRIEEGLAPFARAIGFDPRFDLDSFIAATGLPVVSVAPVNLFGYWKLLCLRKP